MKALSNRIWDSLEVSVSVYGATVVLLSAVIGCPPAPGPAPMPPDASDASPPPAPPPPAPAWDGSTTSACYRACLALDSAGCAEGSGPNHINVMCIVKLQTINDMRTERNPAHGNQALTCDDVAAVKGAADVVKIGQKCSPLPPTH